LIGCTFGNSVWIWNEVIQTIDFVSPPTIAAFSPNGQIITIRCWSTKKEKYKKSDVSFFCDDSSWNNLQTLSKFDSALSIE
jgi:hypothetical protein